MNERQLVKRDPPIYPAVPVAGSYVPQEQPRTNVEIPGIGLKRDYAGILEYWQMVRRHKGAVIVAIFLGGVIGFFMTLSAPRVYQSRMTMEIQALNDEFLNMRAVNPTAATSGGGSDVDIQTHVETLQSNLVLNRVTAKLAAGKRPDNLQPPDRLGMWRKALGINPPTQDALWKEAIGTAAGSVRVRSSGINRIVDALCESTSPQVAADFCNTLATEYIEQNLHHAGTPRDTRGKGPKSHVT